MAKFTREDALEYHRLKGKPGKVGDLGIGRSRRVGE